jgi:hypothetical protein
MRGREMRGGEGGRGRKAYSVGPGVECVCAKIAAGRLVQRVHSGDHRAADVVHVENWRESIEACSVKLVAVHHGDVGKGFEVSLEKGITDVTQWLGLKQ